jgi:hypothetical protein
VALQNSQAAAKLQNMLERCHPNSCETLPATLRNIQNPKEYYMMGRLAGWQHSTDWCNYFLFLWQWIAIVRNLSNLEPFPFSIWFTTESLSYLLP